jgi:hypothetical protein
VIEGHDKNVESILVVPDAGSRLTSADVALVLSQDLGKPVLVRFNSEAAKACAAETPPVVIDKEPMYAFRQGLATVIVDHQQVVCCAGKPQERCEPKDLQLKILYGLAKPGR